MTDITIEDFVAQTPKNRLQHHRVCKEHFLVQGAPVADYEAIIQLAENALEKRLKQKLLLFLAKADAERVRLYWITDPDLRTSDQVRQGASVGGRITSKKHEHKRRKVVMAMDALITGKKSSISNAARIVAGRGVGTSQQANKKIWERYSRKILETVPPAV